MTLEVVTFGCRLNIVEGEAIRRQAQAAGIADMAIVFSMVIFVILTIRGIRIDGTKHPKEPKKGEESALEADDAPLSSTDKD